MNFLEVLNCIGIWIVVIVCVGLITSIISSLVSYIDMKTRLLSTERLDYNKELLSFIMTLVNLEIDNEVKTIVSLNASYNIANLDKDIEKVSNKVFNAIKPEVYTSNANMMTDEYLMQFITESTSRYFISTIRAINDSRLGK